MLFVTFENNSISFIYFPFLVCLGWLWELLGALEKLRQFFKCHDISAGEIFGEFKILLKSGKAFKSSESSKSQKAQKYEKKSF
jgi:hypothetical protein